MDPSESPSTHSTESSSYKHSKEWSKLELPSCATYSKPFCLNNEEYILVPRDPLGVLHKFNIHSLKWREWKEKSASLPAKYYCAVAMDFMKQTLYICCDELLVIINLETDNTETITHSFKFGDEAAAIFVNAQLHIVGGVDNGNHYVYNADIQQFELLHKFTDYHKGYSCHELIYLQSKNILLLMGGWNETIDEPLDTIFMYHLENKKWEKLEAKLPDALYRYAYSVSSDETFIALLGGYDSYGLLVDDIWILKLDTMTFKKCNVCCPRYFSYINALKIIDTEYEELLVIGYLRELSKSLDIDIPFDIMRSIGSWSGTEYIYVIDTSCYEYHYKTKLVDIFKD